MGHFGGACSNYKWRDHGARYVVRYRDKANKASNSNGSLEPKEILRLISNDRRR